MHMPAPYNYIWSGCDLLTSKSNEFIFVPDQIVDLVEISQPLYKIPVFTNFRYTAGRTHSPTTECPQHRSFGGRDVKLRLVSQSLALVSCFVKRCWWPR